MNQCDEALQFNHIKREGNVIAELQRITSGKFNPHLDLRCTALLLIHVVRWDGH